MQLFYSNHIIKNEIILDKDEKKHCINVLRYKVNDVVNVVDGCGNLYDCQLVEYNKHDCKLKINKIHANFNQRDYYVHIAISPIKSHDRLEFFIEKAVEIGVDEISFVKCERTLRKTIKIKRILRTAIVAMKQTMQAKLPKINTLVDFNDFICNHYDGNKFICHLQNNKRKSIFDYKQSFRKKRNSCILIGPEGDFTIHEILKSIESDYKPITLGANRLRTETAGIVSCQLIHSINGLQSV